MTHTAPIARQRRHTLYFLDYAKSFAPVFLDTEVDMTAVRDHRESGPRRSWVSYVLYAAGRVLRAHPEANAAIGGHLWPKLTRHDGVHAKFTLDRRLDGQRVVLSAVLPDVHTASLEEIQQRLEQYRDADPEQGPEFARVRALHKLPAPIGALAFRFATRSPRGRARTMGTVAVTSLGHRAVDGFHSVGGTTITLGVGRVVDRPVVHEGKVCIAPVMRLSLAFDHRVIDGAEAADVLTELKSALEEFKSGEAAG